MTSAASRMTPAPVNIPPRAEARPGPLHDARRLPRARSRGQARASRSGTQDGCGEIGNRADKARHATFDRLKDATAAVTTIGRLTRLVRSDGASSVRPDPAGLGGSAIVPHGAPPVGHGPKRNRGGSGASSARQSAAVSLPVRSLALGQHHTHGPFRRPFEQRLELPIAEHPGPATRTLVGGH